MGKLCSKESQSTINLVQQEKEVSIASYKSDSDKFYELQEKKYNYLNKIDFVDYLYSLVNFSNENATLEDDYKNASLEVSMNDSFFNELFTTDIFQSFLENKILKHQKIYADAGNNEKVTSIFKEGFLAVNSGLGLKLSQDAKAKGNESADKNSIVKKGDALAYGILYCGGPNFAKVKALFNIFSENKELKSNEKFSNFLLSLFIIPSYGMANARNKLSKFDEIGAVDKEKFKEILDSSELKDCQNLVVVANKLIFGEDLSVSLSYDNFKSKFEVNDKDFSLAFLLSPSGVRYMLKKHNV